MVNPVVPTLEPQEKAPSPISPLISEKQALFDSIAHQDSFEGEDVTPSSWASFFTGLLWFGYAVAIVVALVLVWSAAKELLK